MGSLTLEKIIDHLTEAGLNVTGVEDRAELMEARRNILATERRTGVMRASR